MIVSSMQGEDSSNLNTALFFLCSATYKETQNGPIVYLISRDKERRRVIHKFSYTPYFYIREEDYPLFSKLVLENEKYSVLVKDVYASTIQSEEGYKLLRVETYLPFQVRVLRDRLHRAQVETYEADILFPLRYLIDKQVKYAYTIKEEIEPIETEETCPLRLLFLDIEVYMPSLEHNYQYPIIIIGMYDNYTNCFYQLHLKKEGLEKPDYKFSFNCSYKLIECADEVALLKEFRRLFKELEPDVVVTFSPFDMDYILHRMRELGVSYKQLSIVGRVRVENAAIEGVELVDISELYRIVFKEPVYNTLDYISKKELGIGKLELPSKTVFDSWNSNPTSVLAYNLRDIELTVLLEEKLGLIRDFTESVRKEVGCNISDIPYPSRIGDILYLRLNNSKVALRSRSKWKVGEEPLVPQGALIKEPIPSLYQNIAVLDVKEMYPSIIETFNIGWNTYAPYTGDIKVLEGIAYKSTPTSWTAEIIRGLRKKRAVYKQLKKTETDPELKRKYQMFCDALKVIINGVYGAYAYAGVHRKKRRDIKAAKPSRLYSPPIAASITYLGRELIKEAMNYLGQLGYQVVYLDTDGLFVQLQTDRLEEETEELRDRIIEHLRLYTVERWGVQEFKIELDIDKIFTKLILLRKKRYQGVTTTGELVVKGLEMIRSDTAEITTEAEETLGRMILEGVERQKVEEYVYNLYKQVREGKLPLEKIAVRGRCTKTEYDTLTRNYKALLAGRKLLGSEIQVGERFYWVYVIPQYTLEALGKRFKVDVVAFKDTSEFRGLVVDYSRMAEYTIRKPLSKYLEIYSKEKYKNSVQLNLEAFLTA